MRPFVSDLTIFGLAARDPSDDGTDDEGGDDVPQQLCQQVTHALDLGWMPRDAGAAVERIPERLLERLSVT